MMLAFIVGLLISNSIVVLVTRDRVRRQPAARSGSTSRSASSPGAFSLVVGTMFLLPARGLLPDLDRIFGFIGS